MKALILAEHDHNTLKGATASLVTAAGKFASEIHILVAGQNCGAVASAAATLSGVSKVLHVDAANCAHHQAESLSAVLLSLAGDYQAIMAAATTTGKNVMPRVAALLDVAQISEITTVLDSNTYIRPTYAGNAMATVVSSDPVKVLTVRTSAFDEAPTGGCAEIVSVNPPPEQSMSVFVSENLTTSARPELEAAKVVIAGGRGLGSAENFALLEKLADKLGAAIGASRAAVDAGYVGNELQVGQTGKIVAPDLYLAIGISGAIQHLAGMKDSKVIVAINKDAEAPIFQVADYGLVADLFTAVPELEALL